MKVSQSLLSPSDTFQWRELTSGLAPNDAELVFTFGLRSELERPEIFDAIRQRYPAAHIALASTAGNMADQLIDDDHIVCSAVSFERSQLKCAAHTLKPDSDLSEACKTLAGELSDADLRHVFILCDGGTVNGTTLSVAMNRHLPEGVTISGGMAGDGTDFTKTVVGLDAVPQPNTIVAVGVYGASLEIGFGCSGGWSTFGSERKVTRSEGNVLYELDDKPALELYKKYLGDQAEQLPASALRFPLFVNPKDEQPPFVRTILSINEEEGSMTFAGDIAHDATVHFMRASYEDLIDGAQAAATQAQDTAASLVLCVSCIGRRIILGQRTEEEIECVRNTFGSTPVIAGFYSYGELAPTGEEKNCQLHNQTMTVTSIHEL
jgi:hypothetical protein